MKNLLSKIRILILIFPIIAVGLSSCIKNDQNITDTTLYYSVINHSDSRIKVVFYNFWDNERESTTSNDSIVYYDPGEKRNLLVVYNSSSWNGEPENLDTLKGIHVLKIFKNDTIPAQKNYLLRKYWVYSKTNKYKSEISLEITNDSFKP